MFRNKVVTIFATLVLITTPFLTFARTYQSGDFVVPGGYRAELVAKDLSSPRMTAFDGQGRMVIAESGIDGEAKVIRVEPDGSKKVLASGSDFNNQLPVSAVTVHQDKIYISHGGTISVLEQDGKVFTDIIKDLPTNGAYSVGQIVFRGTIMYFTIGTATNSGVVDPDKPDIKDIPCKDIKVSAPAFGSKSTKPEVLKGAAKCNGAILRANSDGSGLQVYAYGLRNNYGLEVGPDDTLYVSNQGIEDRGSRPLINGSDCIYKVTEGAWYGWPDYDCGLAVTDKSFVDKDHPGLKPLIIDPVSKTVDSPIVKLSGHQGLSGFAYAPSNDWGKTTDIFAALNNKVIRIDTTTKEVTDFLVNQNDSGFANLSDVSFGPEGAMYITDRGVAHEENSGAVWKISKINRANPESGFNQKFGLSVFMSLLQLFVLGLLTYLLVRERGEPRTAIKQGFRYGVMAGFYSLAFAVILSLIVFKSYGFAPIQLFNVIYPTTDVLTFSWWSTLLGLISIFVLSGIFGAIFGLILQTTKIWKAMLGSVMYGLTVWALMQYLILPHYTPLQIHRAFSATGFLTIFITFGIILGYLFKREEIKFGE